ncbi:MAG: histidine phosphatase family protein [Solirubrobacteraceae bacterium]|nr:histidine phosphatase family protein [Solirubrobacteraceae bacterium]
MDVAIDRPRAGCIAFAVGLLVGGTSLLAGCGGDDAQPSAPTTRPIVRSLQSGGLTLLMRHAPADTAINQQERLGSCASQRNLTVAGREQARAIGLAVRALRIPIGQVRASPLCRTRDTARLAFGRATVDRRLVNTGILGTLDDDRRRGDALRALVRRPPPAGENTVLVTHTPNISAATGEEDVKEGEILVLGRGGRIVGRVEADQWSALSDG